MVEDEDFQMNHFGFNLFDDLKVSKIVSNLREVEDDYGRLIRVSLSYTVYLYNLLFNFYVYYQFLFSKCNLFFSLY